MSIFNQITRGKAKVGQLTVADDLTVAGAATITGNTTITGNLSVTGTFDQGTATLKVVRIPIGAKTVGEKDTGVDLPTKGIVYDVFLDITTKEDTANTKTIDVGLKSGEVGGDADGFLDGVSTAAAGVVRGNPVYTAGGNETYLSDTTTGALRRIAYEAGSNVAGDVGTYAEMPHILNGTAKSVTYTLGAQHTELVADIVIVYADLT